MYPKNPRAAFLGVLKAEQILKQRPRFTQSIPVHYSPLPLLTVTYDSAGYK